MKKKILSNFLAVRLLVGYLGEKSQFNWWPTVFIGPSSNLFLSPIFPRTTRLSQYHAILEAARRLHDNRIGVGNVYHLFRLPEVNEQEIHSLLAENDPSLPTAPFAGKDAALGELQTIADGVIPAQEGPVNLGRARDIMTPGAIRDMSRTYIAAFSREIECYPYFIS